MQYLHILLRYCRLYHFIEQKKLFPMMYNSSTFGTASLNEIAVTELGPILYSGSPPGVSFASISFIPLQCVPKACVCAMNRLFCGFPMIFVTYGATSIRGSATIPSH